MPIYEYDCPNCGNVFEVRKGWHDDPIEKCNNCGAIAKKRFSIPNIVYKGTGFYTTDNRASRTQSEQQPAARASVKNNGTQKKPKKQEKNSEVKPENKNSQKK